MHRPHASSVSVSIHAADGNTICGFRSTRSMSELGRLFAGLARSLRRSGYAPSASVRLSAGGSATRIISLQAAEREFLHWADGERETVEVPAQNAPSGTPGTLGSLVV